MTIESYVVRWTDETRREYKCDTIANAVDEWASLCAAGRADVRILAVAEDGTKTPMPTYEEALVRIERLRACPLAELVRGFRGDPAEPGSRGPVWAAFDRVAAAVPKDGDAALVDAVEALGFALDVRLRQMRDALDARDAMIAEGPAS